MPTPHKPQRTNNPNREGLYYSAFGESLIEKNTNYGQFSLPYRFNGKELDPETGNYYYGARYYNPVWSVWLGVDPLAHKYPSMSPFVFTGNNPIMLVDPDGREIVVEKGSAEEAAYNSYKSTVQNRLIAAENEESKQLYQGILDELTELEGSEVKYHLVGNGGNKFTYNKKEERIEVQFSLENGTDGEGNMMNPTEMLAHELKHASQFERKTLDLSIDGGGGPLYDKWDEVEARDRQLLFGTEAFFRRFNSSLSYVDHFYRDISEGTHEGNRTAVNPAGNPLVNFPSHAYDYAVKSFEQKNSTKVIRR